MPRDDWKQTLVLTLVLGLVALAIWVIRFEVQWTPSQARALAGIHVFVAIAALLGAAFTIGSIISSRRENREASRVKDTAEAHEREAPPILAPKHADLTPAERWLGLIESDAQIRSAAEQLSTYGIKWVAALGREFMTNGESRAQLSAIVQRLQSQAEREDGDQEEKQWAAAFSVTAEGERVTPEALAILKLAKVIGYDLSVDADGVIIARIDTTTSYLNSISDIMLFSKNRLAA